MNGSKAWLVAAAAAFVAIWLESSIGFGLAFSPGWANGWPGGLSVHTVWAAGMSLLLGLVLMTIAVGVGAAVAAACSRRGLERRGLLLAFLAWLLLAAALAWPATSWAYGRIHASAVEMWPGGYYPGGVPPN
ncbi:MAG: hypothetical protein U0800_02400 [Isosphaeraceae bacterium]